MAYTLVEHSPLALKRYMSDMDLSADTLARLTNISANKIIQALQDNKIFKLSQLENIARILYVPTVYLTISDIFFEKDIPAIIEFRNQSDIPDDERSRYKERALVEEFLLARKDYLSVIEALEEELQPFTLELSGKLEFAEQDAQKIINYFNFYEHKRKIKNSDDYYNAWREIVELKDVLVFDKGMQKYGSDGMCIYFEDAPVIAILSSGQSASRRLFTLIHEVVHLGLGDSVFDGDIIESDDSSNYNYIETYCNRVAGHVIAPINIIENSFDTSLNIEENVLKIRNKVKASKTAIAIQLRTTGYISQDELRVYLDSLNKSEKPQGFGLKKEVIVLKYFGYGFVEKVMSAMWQDQISSSTAKKMLGFHGKTDPKSFKQLQEKVF